MNLLHLINVLKITGGPPLRRLKDKEEPVSLFSDLFVESETDLDDRNNMTQLERIQRNYWVKRKLSDIIDYILNF
jgi:hypothetical protein